MRSVNFSVTLLFPGSGRLISQLQPDSPLTIGDDNVLSGPIRSSGPNLMRKYRHFLQSLNWPFLSARCALLKKFELLSNGNRQSRSVVCCEVVIPRRRHGHRHRHPRRRHPRDVSDVSASILARISVSVSVSVSASWNASLTPPAHPLLCVTNRQM